MFGSMFSTVCGVSRVKLLSSDSWWTIKLSLILKRLQRLGRPRGWECQKGPFGRFFSESLIGSGGDATGYNFKAWLPKALWGLGVHDEGGTSFEVKRALVLLQWTMLFGMSVALVCYVLESWSRRADEARRRNGY